MTRTLLLGLLLVCNAVLAAQNTYAPINELNADQGWLRSSAAAEVSGTTRLLLYQHGGATVSTSGANIGQVTNLNGTGHYDLNRVERVGGDTIFLALPLTNDYELPFSQLILVESAEEVQINETTAAAPFNGITGGVLFLAAERSLVIDASLVAQASGFRGGQGQEADSDCNRFTTADGNTYGLNDWRGSRRGEGVAGVVAGQEAGRAATANGGGGGNDHNAGGGGGANTTSGGIGARNILMGLVFNNACRGNFPGLGGRGLDDDQARLFFGGGGGAGHANNTNTAAGGNGGGLVVLWAPSVTFTGNGSVDAGGSQPDIVDGDGGGGGGAGGTVLIVAESLSGSPTLDLSGGQGADVDNPSDRCFGPGGGGSGGRLLIAAFERSSWSPEVDLSRGGFGQRLNSSDCTADEEPGGTGTDGIQQSVLFPVPFGGFVQSADTLCADQQLLLTDASNGAQQASWKIIPASDALQADLLGLSLRVSFADTASGTFRAVQTLVADGREYPGDTATFTVFPIVSAGGGEISFNDEFVNASVDNPQGFETIRYDFGDGTVIDTTAASLDHTYTLGGDYTVTITLINARCGSLEVATNSVSLAEFAFADADVKTAEGCAPFTLEVNDISTGVYGASRWDFPGADTEVVFDSLTPVVVYSVPGTYTGTLTLLDALGPDTIDQFVVVVTPTPTADFTFTQDTATVVFTSTTDVADSFEWDFGDGSGSSTEQNPAYSYDSTGTFTVTLTATLGECFAIITQEVTIEVLSDLGELARRGVRLFPNPTSGTLSLRGEANLVDLFELSGRYLGALSGQEADLSGLPAGTYVVRLRAGERTFSVRVIRR